MFHFFRVLKKFTHKRGMSRFCVENFLFLSTEKFLRGTVLCFRKLLVWKQLRDKKVGVTFYRRKFFCPKSPKKNVGEPSWVSERFWYQIILCSRGVTICRSFLLHSTVIIRKRSLVFQKCSGIEKNVDNKVSRIC